MRPIYTKKPHSGWIEYGVVVCICALKVCNVYTLAIAISAFTVVLPRARTAMTREGTRATPFPSNTHT